MIARRISTVIGLVMLVISLGYLFAYLYWWEWNHALIAGVFVLAIEVALATMLVVARLSRLEQQMKRDRPAPGSPTPSILRHAAPAPTDPFAWLTAPARRGEMHVFVPVLLGAGVILSAVAWFVERLARALGGPSLERDLAGRLERLSPPPRGFLATDHDPLALLRGPVRR